MNHEADRTQISVDEIKETLGKIVNYCIVHELTTSQRAADMCKLIAARQTEPKIDITKEELQLMRDAWRIRLGEHSELNSLIESLPRTLGDVMRVYVAIGHRAYLRVRDTGEALLWVNFESAKGDDNAEAAMKWKIDDPHELEALREIANSG